MIKLSKKDLEEQMEEQKKLCDQMDQIDDVNQPDMVRYLYHPGSIHLSFRV